MTICSSCINLFTNVLDLNWFILNYVHSWKKSKNQEGTLWIALTSYHIRSMNASIILCFVRNITIGYSRILSENIRVSRFIVFVARRSWWRLLELNVQADHVHVVLSIPSKYSVSSLMGCLKGQTFHSSFRVIRKTGEVLLGSSFAGAWVLCEQRRFGWACVWLIIQLLYGQP